MSPKRVLVVTTMNALLAVTSLAWGQMSQPDKRPSMPHIDHRVPNAASLIRSLGDFAVNVGQPALSAVSLAWSELVLPAVLADFIKEGAQTDAYILYERNHSLAGPVHVPKSIYPFNPFTVALLDPQRYKIKKIRITGTGRRFVDTPPSFRPATGAPGAPLPSRSDLIDSWDAKIAGVPVPTEVNSAMTDYLARIPSQSSDTQRSLLRFDAVELDGDDLATIGRSLLQEGDIREIFRRLTESVARFVVVLSKAEDEARRDVEQFRSFVNNEKAKEAAWQVKFNQTFDSVDLGGGFRPMLDYDWTTGRVCLGTCSQTSPTVSSTPSRPRRTEEKDPDDLQSGGGLQFNCPFFSRLGIGC